MPCRFGYKCGFVPIIRGVVSGSVKCMACCSGKLIVMIHLPDLFGDGVDWGAACNAFEHAARPASNFFIITVGNGQMHTRVTICGGTKKKPLFAETNSPRIVIGVAKKFDFRTIRLHAVKTSSERLLFIAYDSCKARVPNHAIDPII